MIDFRDGRTEEKFRKRRFTKRKVLAEKKKGFQEIIEWKEKLDMPVTADLENILNSYNMTAEPTMVVN